MGRAITGAYARIPAEPKAIQGHAPKTARRETVFKFNSPSDIMAALGDRAHMPPQKQRHSF